MRGIRQENRLIVWYEEADETDSPAGVGGVEPISFESPPVIVLLI